MKCVAHPKYKGVHRPRPTPKNPMGCSACWQTWNAIHETSTAMVVYKQIDLVVRVTGDAFQSAIELSKLGLIVDTVLSKRGVVMGWCSEHVLKQIVESDLVSSYEQN